MVRWNKRAKWQLKQRMQGYAMGIDGGNARGRGNDGIFMGTAVDGMQKCCLPGSCLAGQKQMAAGAVHKPRRHGRSIVIPLSHGYKV